MSCDCKAGLTVQLHNGGTRYPVIPAARHSELSYWFSGRCTRCGAKTDEPFERVDTGGQVLADQTQDLPLADVLWLRGRCGPFTCGCDEEQLHG